MARNCYFFIILLILSTSSTWAESQWPVSIPFVYQRQNAFPNNGESYCAPSAYVNLILSLRLAHQIHSSIKLDSREDAIAAVKLIANSNCMDTSAQSGTDRSNVRYAVMNCIRLLTSSPMYMTFRSFPDTYDFLGILQKELSRGTMALMSIGYYREKRRLGGHAVVMVEGRLEDDLEVSIIDSDSDTPFDKVVYKGVTSDGEFSRKDIYNMARQNTTVSFERQIDGVTERVENLIFIWSK